MRKAFSSLLYLILVIEVVIQSSRCHPDCDHKKILNNFLDMCKVYSPYSTLKRETKANNNGANGLEELRSLILEAEADPFYHHPTNSEGEVKPTNDEQPQSTKNPFLQWVSNNLHMDSGNTRRKNDFQTPEVPNEPEDFASFNNWYLNPVYAGAEWQSPIERWRRTGHMKEEIWHFVHNICCVTGCPFPEAYWEFDKNVNICGMR